MLAAGISGPAPAQCVQCFRNAAAQQESARQAMNFGILLLLVPVALILSGFVYLAWRRRDS